MQGVESRLPTAVKLRWRWLTVGCFWLVFAAAFGCIAQDGRPAQGGTGAPQDTASKVAPVKDAKGQPANATEIDRKRQLSDESTELLNMALALKAAVDKTTKDTLSLNVIKKADQIEKLAKSVKGKMKQSSGS